MNCIFCKEKHTRVYGSGVKNGKSIRYRRCISCKKKFKTEEIPVDHKAYVNFTRRNSGKVHEVQDERLLNEHTS